MINLVIHEKIYSQTKPYSYKACESVLLSNDRIVGILERIKRWNVRLDEYARINPTKIVIKKDFFAETYQEES